MAYAETLLHGEAKHHDRTPLCQERPLMHARPAPLPPVVLRTPVEFGEGRVFTVKLHLARPRFDCVSLASVAPTSPWRTSSDLTKGANTAIDSYAVKCGERN
jgi:hypothetical protein